MPRRSFDPLVGFGLRVTFQLAPLDVSIRVRSVFCMGFVAQPAATQEAMEMQEIELRKSTGKVPGVPGVSAARN
jgi:hypothetical protein